MCDLSTWKQITQDHGRDMVREKYLESGAQIIDKLGRTTTEPEDKQTKTGKLGRECSLSLKKEGVKVSFTFFHKGEE